MKQLIILAIAFAGFQAQALTETEKTQLKTDFESATVQTIIPSDLIGQYTGSCTSHWDEEQKEALYINSFENVKGDYQIIPLSTLQVYDGSTIPERLKYLTTGSAKNLSDIAEFIREGYTGADNNVGNIAQGRDFAYVYSTQVAADRTSITLKVSDVKTSDNLTPPLLRGCEYGLSDGGWVYQNCNQLNDQTVFKRNAKGQLVSKRTTDQRVKGQNLLSFQLPAIENYCAWTKVN